MSASFGAAPDSVARLQRELDQLRETLEHRTRELHESQAVAKVGSWATDLETMAVTWSPETHRIFGTDPAQFAPTHAGFLALVHPDDRPAVDSAFAASLVSNDPQDIEHRVDVGTGRPRYVKERWQVFLGLDGHGRRAVGTCQDITVQKAVEAERLRSQRLESIGNLAGGIAHDLNNVLAPILMSVALLKEDETDPERLDTLHTVEECARRGADLVRQVLTYARGSDGAQTAVDVGALLPTVARVLRETFPRGIVLQVDVAPHLPLVMGDATQLHQVLMNLAVNARDAVGATGRVTLRASQGTADDGRPTVVLEVEDNGGGIPPSVQEQMFDPFFTTKAVGHGTGLGLSTVQSIVRAHHGRVWVSSEVGAGTVFQVSLPAADPQDLAAGSDPLLQPPSGDNKTVLVVDDEDAILQMARKTLERHGYRVRVAKHGAEAVDIYSQNPADISVVITDMSMPVMDGPTAIRLLRAIDPHVRIIASSGLESVGGAAKAIGTGSVLFIPKPYTAEALLRAVGKAITD